MGPVTPDTGRHAAEVDTAMFGIRELARIIARQQARIEQLEADAKAAQDTAAEVELTASHNHVLITHLREGLARVEHEIQAGGRGDVRIALDEVRRLRTLTPESVVGGVSP